MTSGTRDGKGKFTRTPATARRDADAAALRGKGRTFEQIASELGYASRAKAYEAVQRAFASVPYEQVEEAKRLDLERIDRMIEFCTGVMEREHLTVSQGRVVGKRVGWEKDEVTGEVLHDADGAPIPCTRTYSTTARGWRPSGRSAGLLERRAKMTGYDAPARARIEIVDDEVARPWRSRWRLRRRRSLPRSPRKITVTASPEAVRRVTEARQSSTRRGLPAPGRLSRRGAGAAILTVTAIRTTAGASTPATASGRPILRPGSHT